MWLALLVLRLGQEPRATIHYGRPNASFLEMQEMAPRKEVLNSLCPSPIHTMIVHIILRRGLALDVSTCGIIWNTR